MIDGYDTNGIVVHHLVILLPVLVAVMRAVGFPRERRLDRWLDGHGLERQGEGRTLAARYLNRTRWIRTGGFIVGWAVLPLAWLWITRDAAADLPGGFPLAVTSFGAAVVLAELVRPRPDGAVVATAPRVRRTYVPAFTRRDPWIIAAGFLVLIALSAATDADPGTQAGRAGMAAMAWGAMIGMQRWILAQPQRAASLELLRVDDAIRSTGATALSALGYGASVATLGSGLYEVVNTGSLHGPARTLVALTGLAVGAAGWAFTVGFLRLENTWLVPRLRESAR